jgi:hypothetical protein
VETTFQTLKNALITAPVLALPDFRLQFTIETDACDVGIGAVLSQCDVPVVRRGTITKIGQDTKRNWSGIEMRDSSRWERGKGMGNSQIDFNFNMPFGTTFSVLITVDAHIHVALTYNTQLTHTA